jgi:hypothetical protein
VHPGAERAHREHGPAGRCDTDDGCLWSARLTDAELAEYADAVERGLVRRTLRMAEALTEWVFTRATPDHFMDSWMAGPQETSDDHPPPPE